jgi:hypothetical protein
MKYTYVMLAVLIALQPAMTCAQRAGGARGGGGHAGGGMRGGARPAGGGGFNLSGDTGRGGGRQRPQGGNVNNGNRNGNNVNNGNRNGNNVNNGNRNGNNVNNGNRNGNNINNGNRNGNNINNGNRNGNNINNGNRNNVNVNGNRTNINVSGNTVIRNPVYVNNSAWGWNRGVAWAPASNYWGGGFWGAMAIGVTSAAVGAAVYGSIVSNNVTYNSYQVQPSSPGATFLSNYQLQQVQCGASGLVVVYGPQNSVICANPNNLVAAGNYRLDAETLSLTAM